MQSKGAIRLVAILLAVACIWQLSFTAITRIQEKKAAEYARVEAEKFVTVGDVVDFLSEEI